MPTLEKEMEEMKENAIRMANHHRAHCDGKHCNISLYLLRKLVEKAGISLTEEEKIIFL